MFTAHLLNIVLRYVMHISGQYWPFAIILIKHIGTWLNGVRDSLCEMFTW